MATKQKSQAPKAPVAANPAVAPMFAQLLAPTQPTAAPAAPTVALRGGQAVQAIKLVGKVYRTKAQHNMDWWATIASMATTDKPATVQALVAAKVPTHFIGYCVRRGYLAPAQV